MQPIDLSPGDLLYYGGVEWLNISDFLGKIKKVTKQPNATHQRNTYLEKINHFFFVRTIKSFCERNSDIIHYRVSREGKQNEICTISVCNVDNLHNDGNKKRIIN